MSQGQQPPRKNLFQQELCEHQIMILDSTSVKEAVLGVTYYHRSAALLAMNALFELLRSGDAHNKILACEPSFGNLEDFLPALHPSQSVWGWAVPKVWDLRSGEAQLEISDWPATRSTLAT